MGLMIAGLIGFFMVHAIPMSGPTARTKLIDNFGAAKYKIAFALISFASFTLIVLGWQAAEIELLYMPPEWGRHVTPLFVLFGIILFIASNAPTNIRRLLRHPQLIGVSLWGVGHLFSNGETRSILLFGGLVAFSLYGIWASNKRDGEWVKREPVPLSRDIVTLVISLVVYGALFHFHESFTGMPVMP